MSTVCETKTEVKIVGTTMLVEEYKWRDKSGTFHRIDDMETRHLFHVVRMVWDHSMPREWQTRFKRRYRFSEFYSDDYMALTVRLMLPALLHRRDLTPEMMYWLSFMENCLKNKRLQIPFVLKIGYDNGLAA